MLFYLDNIEKYDSILTLTKEGEMPIKIIESNQALALRAVLQKIVQVFLEKKIAFSITFPQEENCALVVLDKSSFSQLQSINELFARIHSQKETPIQHIDLSREYPPYKERVEIWGKLAESSKEKESVVLILKAIIG